MIGTSQAWCDFCYATEFQGDIGNTPAFKRLFSHPTPSRKIYESKHFVAIVGLGSITAGYILLLSREHFSSMAQLPSNDYYEELEYVYNQIVTTLTKLYVRPIIFEHGPMSVHKNEVLISEGGGSCMDHAHFHFFPVPAPTEAMVQQLKELHAHKAVTNLTDLRQQWHRKIPYLFLETTQGERWLFDAPLVPSQYLRRFVAEIMGVPEQWNWHTYPGYEHIEATIEHFKKVQTRIG